MRKKNLLNRFAQIKIMSMRHIHVCGIAVEKLHITKYHLSCFLNVNVREIYKC